MPDLSPLGRALIAAAFTLLFGIGGSVVAKRRWGHPVSWVAAVVVPVIAGVIVYFFAVR
jgi:hypothetical protein